MPQRKSHGPISFEPLPPHPEDQRALDRIGFQRSEWNELNWYIQFAAREIDRLSPGEQLSLKEEVRAVERTLFRRAVSSGFISEPSDDAIRKSHAYVREKLTELADGAFALFVVPETVVTMSDQGWSEQLGVREILEYHLVQLLKKFVGGVQRCPYSECGKIYLKSRSNANYCSRTCQNRAAMRALREKRKQDQALEEDKVEMAAKRKPRQRRKE